MDAVKYNLKIEDDTELTIKLPDSYRGKVVEILVVEKLPEEAIAAKPIKKLPPVEIRKEIADKHRGSMPAYLDSAISLEEEWYLQ